MTAPQLLAWVTATLLLQLAAGIAWTLWQRSSAAAIVENLSWSMVNSAIFMDSCVRRTSPFSAAQFAHVRIMASTPLLTIEPEGPLTMQTRLPTEERQAEIVAAALNLARDISPVSITTGDIASAIGVSQGAVFKHFPTKDAIWVAAMKWVRERLLAKLDEAARAETSGVLALEAVFRAHVAFVMAHPGAPRIIFHELQQPADSPVKQEVRALLQAYRQLLLVQFKGGMKSGELPTGLDPEAAATLFVGIVQGLVMQSMLTGKPAAMKAQGDGVFRIYLRGIRAAA